MSKQISYISCQKGIPLHKGICEIENVEVQMEKLKPEKLVEMLRKRYIDISVEQATLSLEFLRLMANIVVAQYLRGERRELKQAELPMIQPNPILNQA